MLVDCHGSKDVLDLCIEKSHIKTHVVITEIKSKLHQVVWIAIEVKSLGKPAD